MQRMINTARLSIRFIEEDDWSPLIDIWEDFSRSEYAQYDVPHTTDEAEVRKKAAHWAQVSQGKPARIDAVSVGRKVASIYCRYCYCQYPVREIAEIDRFSAGR